MSDFQSPLWLRLVPEIVRNRLEGRTSLHAIIHNTGWLLGDKVLRLGMGLLVGAWVARYLGPTQYGELAYALAYVAFFQSVAELGLNGIVIRDMARDRQASPAILGTVFRLRLFAGAFCWLVAMGLMSVIRPGDIHTLALTAIVAGSLVFQSADTVDLWFQSQTQSKRTVVAKAISYLISNLIKIVFILMNAPLIFFAITGIAEIVFSAIALYYSYRRYPAPLDWTWDIERGKKLIIESWPYMIAGLAVTIYIRIDQVMLREMLGTYELGMFSAALPLSTLFYFIPAMVAQSVGPAIAYKKMTDHDLYYKSIARLFRAMWCIMIPVSMIISLLSDNIIQMLYGISYSYSAKILGIHVFSNIPVSLGIMQSIWIINEKRNKLSMIKAIIGAVANIVLNLVMIPKYGAVGAAMVTVISVFISDVLSNIVFAPEIFRLQLFFNDYIK